MKNLILGATCLLLAAKVHAQQVPPSPPAPVAITTPNVNVNVSRSVNVVTDHSFNHNVAPQVKIETRSSVNGKVHDYSYSSSTTNQEQADDPLKTKTFSKSFTLDRNDKVNLSNQYGNTTIKTWDKNEIKVDVDIKAYATTEADAQQLLDDVSIQATKTGDLVAFKTNIGNRNGNWGRKLKNGRTIWRREVKVYYTVYMPSSNALTTAQSYGNVIIDDFSGPTSIKVEYGNLIAGNLNNTNNYISVEYGKADLKNVNRARIKHEYGGGLTLASINDLELEAEYTSVKIGTIKNNANIKHEYGSGVTIGYAGSLNLTAQYANIKLEKLAGTFTGKVVYGKLEVGQVEPGCKIFNASSDFSSVSLGFNTNYGGVFNVTTSYGGFKHGANVTAEKSDKGSTSKAYAGQIGKGGTGKVAISSTYGSVTFK